MNEASSMKAKILWQWVSVLYNPETEYYDRQLVLLSRRNNELTKGTVQGFKYMHQTYATLPPHRTYDISRLQAFLVPEFSTLQERYDEMLDEMHRIKNFLTNALNLVGASSTLRQVIPEQLYDRLEEEILSYCGQYAPAGVSDKQLQDFCEKFADLHERVNFRLMSNMLI